MDAITALKDRPQTQAGEKSRAKGRVLAPPELRRGTPAGPLSLLTDRVHFFGGIIAAQMSIGFGRQGHSYDHFRE